MRAGNPLAPGRDPQGAAGAVIPAKAAANLSIRTVPGQKVADVAAVRAALNDALPIATKAP